MKITHIKDKLVEMDVTIEAINLGDFDFIGELTAKRQRPRDNEDYLKLGAFYRANYERGILLYYLIRQFNIETVLEIGTGRGYTTLCAARAFVDSGRAGSICTIDPNIKEEYVKQLTTAFPQQWFQSIRFYRGSSEGVLTNEISAGSFDIVILDGDVSYEGVKHDWELIKDRWCKFVIIDTPDNDNVKRAIDDINVENKELIVMDRRLFPDDRPLKELSYGQTLITKKGVELEW